MNRSHRLVFAGIVLSCAQFLCRADVRLASCFSSGMVLQRDVPARISGYADAGEAVVVRVGDQVAGQAVGAGANQLWSITLPVLLAGPVADIRVTGKNEITLTDLLAGDVWVCSGQSNMAQTLAAGDWCNYGGVVNGEAELAAAEHPQLRLYTSGSSKTWAACSPASAGTFSAAAYFFGRELQQHLGVPVGLIAAAVGGTPAEYWVPLAAREADPAYAAELIAAKALLQELKASFYADRQAMADWSKAVAQARKNGLPVPERPLPTLTPEQEEQVKAAIHTESTGRGYATLVKPLTAMTVKGVIWYQGESNVMRADKYAELMTQLIGGWRADWGQDALPFLIMQLVNFRGGSGSWPALRAAQQTVAETMPDTGLAVGIDIGEPKNIHPKNKQDVGKRLALVALKQVYDRDVVASGPTLKTAEFAAGRVTLSFAPGGQNQQLIFKTEADSGFEVAGADARFMPVPTVEVRDNTLVLACPEIVEPRAVRYAWADNPAATLFNTAGLPAAPFQKTSATEPGR